MPVDDRDSDPIDRAQARAVGRDLEAPCQALSRTTGNSHGHGDSVT